MFSFSGDSSWKYDDLPTVTEPDDYARVANDAFADRLELLSSGDWEDLKHENGVLVQQKIIDGSDIVAVRTESILENASMEQILKYLYNPSPSERGKLYDELESYEVIKTMDNDIQVGYSIFGASMVTSRDFLAIRSYKQIDENRYLVVVQSINDKDRPFNTTYVRGSSNSGMLLTQMDNCVKMETVDHIDPRGWVPTMIINSFKDKADQWIIKLRDQFK